MRSNRFWLLSALWVGICGAVFLTSQSDLAGAATAPQYRGALAAVQPVAGCETLAKTDLKAAAQSDVAISKAGLRTTPVGDFCEVLGVIAPAIRFEVDLPAKGWTQRYLQTGCGGLCGNLDVRISNGSDCLPALRGELAVASDDMGHQGGDANFGEDPQKRIDFAYRGNHVTAMVAKALIRAYYGRAPRYSYFSGCSDGGREALVEAQRFPDDFDGIAAGAPAMNFQVQNSFYHAWMADSNTGPDGKIILIAARLPILHRAVVAACDELDGLKDGLLSDPRLCHFDPGTIQCAPGAATDNCLTSAEVAVARKFYAGPVDAGGAHFTIGGPQYGSELAWAGVYVTRAPEDHTFSENISSGSSQYVIFPQVSAADGDVAHFVFTQENFRRLDDLHPLYDATNTDLSAFQRRGGRLILFHGWSDQHISPINTIAYYRGVQKQLGQSATASFVRLFLFPGMYHCGGGDGFSQFDNLSPLMAWVEEGKAPDRIVAGQIPERDVSAPPPAPPAGRGAAPRAPREGTPFATAKLPVQRERPTFPYPMQAHYVGSGDMNDPANYVAVASAYREPEQYDWLGAHLMGPGNQKAYRVEGGKLVAGR
jgi:feruloyl esterase